MKQSSLSRGNVQVRNKLGRIWQFTLSGDKRSPACAPILPDVVLLLLTILYSP